jgi:hypothetical protein
MKIKENTALLILIPLGAAFCIICMLLWFGGDKPALIRSKMKIGAILLSLSCFISCGPRAEHIDRTCYKPAMPRDTVTFDNNDQLKAGDSIKGKICSPTYEKYYYTFGPLTGNEDIQTYMLSCEDLSSGKKTRDFRFRTDPATPPGEYRVQIYVKMEKPGGMYPVGEDTVIIVGE